MAIDSKHNDKISNIVNTDDKMDKVSGSEDVVKRANESDNEVQPAHQIEPASSKSIRSSLNSFHDLPMKPRATPNLPILHRC